MGRNTGRNANKPIKGNDNDNVLAGVFDKINKINGGDGNDTITGGNLIDYINAGDGDDVVFGGDGDDWLKGGDGNDVLSGGAGDDTIFGGDGLDTVVVSGVITDYIWTTSNNGTTTITDDNVIDGDDGTDTLKNIESIQFADGYVYHLDGTNNNPYAIDDTNTTDEDNTTTGNVLDNDTEFDGDGMSVSAVNGVSDDVGEEITLASGAKLIVNSNGDYTYDPNGQFDYLDVDEEGFDTFTYEVSDGLGGTSTATVTVTIAGVNVVPLDVEGSVTDGYIVGATVYSDEDGDGTLSAGDVSTTTGGEGEFALTGVTGELHMFGGIDAATGLNFEGELKAPAGSTSITSLSTLVSELMDMGMDKTAAIAAVNAEYGITYSDPADTFLNIDPIQAVLADVDDTGKTIMGKATQVLNSVIQIASLIEGASSGTISISDAMDAVFVEIANGINNGTGYDLISTSDIASLIQAVTVTVNADPDTTLTTANIDAVVDSASTLISNTNTETQTVIDDGALTGEELLTDFSQISIVAQSTSSDAISESAADGNSTDIDDVDLDQAIIDAEDLVGEVDGIQSTTYTPNGRLMAVYGNADSTGFEFMNLQTYSRVDVSDVEQLIIDNSARTDGPQVDIYDKLFAAGRISEINLADTGIIYYGASGRDDLDIRHEYGSLGTNIEVHLGDGNDHVGAGHGNDLLFGDGGNDAIEGSLGNDTINGGGGDDTLNGGSGEDVFVYTALAEGHDVIYNFSVSDDTVDLDALFDLMGINGAENRADWLETDNSNAGTTVITVSGYDDFLSITVYADLGTHAAGDLDVSDLATMGLYVGDES